MVYKCNYFNDGTPCAVKVARTVWSGGKIGNTGNGRFTNHYAYDTVNFRTPKGGRETIKTFALENGYTMNDFLRKMVCEGMRKEGFDFDPNLIFPSAVMPEELIEDKE